MNLILEGPDNAGKTTLGRKLVEHSDGLISIHHPGGKPASIADEVTCYEGQLALLGGNNNILDRVTPISQQVYNPDPMLYEMRAEMLVNFAAWKPLIVYCRPSTDRLLRTDDFSWRQDETEEHKQKIIRNQHTFIERYDRIFAKIPHLPYDYEDDVAASRLFNLMLAAFRGSEMSRSKLEYITNVKVKP